MITNLLEPHVSKAGRAKDRPIFSAYDIGRITVQKQELARHYPVAAIEADAPAHRIHDLYNKYADLDFLPVVQGGEIVGYVRRQMFLAQLSETAYSRELLLRQEVSAGALMDTRVVMLDAFTNLSEASEILTALDYGHGFLWMKRRSAVHRLSAMMNHEVAMPFMGIQETLAVPPRHFRLKKGDVLFACSDGIVEARSTRKEEYGPDRVRRLLRSFEGESAHAANQSIHLDWGAFIQGARRTDDVSMLTMMI